MAAADLTQCVWVGGCVCVSGGVSECMWHTHSHTRIPSPLALAQNCRLSCALRVWLKFHFFMSCPAKKLCDFPH